MLAKAGILNSMEPGNTGWWVADVLANSGVVALFSWAVWVIGSICLHELGHGWAAIWQGDTTPRQLGRMNFNPLVHMGKFSLIMFALVGIAWGAMPVDPSRFRHRHGDAIVAFAGPAVNIVLALACIVCAGIWIGLVEDSLAAGVADAGRTFFMMGAMLNIALLILNLLPIPPLDGSRILADFVPRYRQFLEHPNAPVVGLIVLLLVFFRGSGVIFGSARDVTWAGIDLVSGVFHAEPEFTLITTEEELELFISHLPEVFREPFRSGRLDALTDGQRINYFSSIGIAMYETDLQPPERDETGEFLISR